MSSSIERSTVSQVCGHESTYWESNKRGGPSIVAQLQSAQSRACKACERQSEYDAASQFATEEGLPIISGNSEAQERYAECVRYRVIREWRHQCELYPAGDVEALVLVTRIDAHLEGMTDAGQWCGLDTMSGGSPKYPRRVKRTINEIIGIVVGQFMEWPFWTVAEAVEPATDKPAVTSACRDGYHDCCDACACACHAVDAAISTATLAPSTQAAGDPYGSRTSRCSMGDHRCESTDCDCPCHTDRPEWREPYTMPKPGSLMARLAEPVSESDTWSVSFGSTQIGTVQIPSFAAQAEPQFERIIATVRNC